MSIPPAIVERLADDLAGRAASVWAIERPRRGEGVAAAGAGGEDAVARLDHVARAAHEQAVPGVDHDQHGLEPPEHPVGPPELGQLGRRPGDVVGIVLELGLEPLQQGEAVGRAAGEADQDLAVEQLADLDRVGLHDGRAERHLAVAADGHPPAAPDRQDRRRMPVQGTSPRSASVVRSPILSFSRPRA